MNDTKKRYGKTLRKAAALPLETIVEDADGYELVRLEGGWRFVEDAMDETTGPLSVTSLSFPLRIVLEHDEDRNLSRERRRKAGRRRAKASAKKVLRQVHAAEDQRAADRLEALEDRAAHPHGAGL